MIFPNTILLSSLFLGTVAGHIRAGSDRSRGHSRLARLHSVIQPRKTFKLVDMYQGNSFLNEWEFFTGQDPTHGSVAFQSKSDAISKGLAIVQADGTAVLAVDDKTVLPVGTPRDSVRISTKKTYTGGLFIADFFAMPHGCSVWPAYWSVGPNWPTGGEIDVLEGVHNQNTNVYSLHSSAGCTLSTDNFKVTAKVLNTQCASGNGQNAGCNFVDASTSSYGKGFNLIGGGVYAHLWDDSGIKIWHFARNAIPNDVAAKQPDPSSWGTPAAFWSSASCDFATHFQDHSLVLDITLCGDLGNPTFSSAGCNGTCAGAVADPTNFKFAKFEMNYIAVYQ